MKNYSQIMTAMKGTISLLQGQVPERSNPNQWVLNTQTYTNIMYTHIQFKPADYIYKFASIYVIIMNKKLRK